MNAIIDIRLPRSTMFLNGNTWGENIQKPPHFFKLLAGTKGNVTNEDPKISLDQSSVAAEPAPDLISNLVPLYCHENSQNNDISPINSDSSKNFQENTQKVETGTWKCSRSFAQPRFTITYDGIIY